MSKKILIFGGGNNQLSLIKAAKNLGVGSIVIDPDPGAPGRGLADNFEVVGASDYNLTKKIATKYSVDGIVTSQMENPLSIMADLAWENGYIFPSREVILQCRNKYLMKIALQKSGIQCARGVLFPAGVSISQNKLDGFKYPLIIKPVDSHSSRGVYKVDDFETLKRFEFQTRSFSSDNSLIIEEFLNGKEYSVECLTYLNETYIIQVTEKIVNSFPYTVEIGHIQPAIFSHYETDEIHNVVTKAIKALGIENSASHVELKLTPDGPYIIEVGARLGGDFISSYLTLASTGISMDEGAINIALGYKPETSRKFNKFSYIKYLELPAGKLVVDIKDWQQIMTSPELIFASVLIKKGQVVQPVTDSSKRAGFVIVQGDSKSDVVNLANEKIEILKEFINLL